MQSAYFFADFENNATTIELDVKESHHALNVRRIKSNEEVFVTNGKGLVASASAISFKPIVLLQVNNILDISQAKPKVTVLQAVLKSDRSDFAVELMSEVGVDEIIFWPAARSVAKVDEKVSKIILKWNQTALAALKQSRSSWLTKISYLNEFNKVIDYVATKQFVYLLDFDASEKIKNHSIDAEAVFIVGPEGGLSTEEKSKLIEHGVKTINIGSTVLRGSTAGAVACAIVRNF